MLHHGLEAHDLLGHVRGHHGGDIGVADGLLDVLTVASGGPHDEGQPPPAVELGIGIYGSRVGVVDAQEPAVLLPDFGDGRLALPGTDEANGPALDGSLRLDDLGAGQ